MATLALSRASSPEKKICTAIRERRLLQFQYSGKPRVVAPYCYGFSIRDSAVLRAVQVGGESGSGGFGFGKLWTVEQMSDVQVATETFTPDDPDYNPNDTAMKRVVCRID